MTPSPLPDRAEAAAVELLSLADAIDARGPASSRTLVRVADVLVWVAQTHPLRCVDGVDRVVAMVDDIRHGRATVPDLRAFAAELRAGRKAMFERGWGRLLRGGVES